MTRRRSLVVVGLLYLGQDVVFTFFLVTLVGVLRERGVPLQSLALIGLVSIAWTIRFLWAPLVDRFGWRRFGHYRSWVLVTQVLMVGLVCWMATLDPVDDLGAVVWLVTALVFVSATQETAVNALGVVLLGPRDRTLGTGLLLGAVYVGTLIGGGLVLVVYQWAGWAFAMAVLAVAVAMPTLAVIGLREPDSRPPRPDRLWSLFRRPGMVRWVLLLIPLYVLGGYTGDAILTPLLVDRGWSLDMLGVARSLTMAFAGLVAAGAASAVIARFGLTRALVAFGLAEALALLSLLLVVHGVGGVPTAFAVLLAQTCVGTSVMAAVLVISFVTSRPAFAASDYSLQQSALGLCRTVSASVGVGAVGWFGYEPVVLVCAGLALVGTAVTARCHPRVPQESTVDELTVAGRKI